MPWERLPRLTKADIAAARRDRKKTRFLIDESEDVAVADRLRRQRLNVVHASEVGLAGHPDEDVFAYGWRENRVIVTRDIGFLDDRVFPPQRNPGIVLLPGDSTARNLPTILDWVARTIGRSRDLWKRTKINFSGDGSFVVNTFEQDEGHIVSTRYRVRAGQVEMWAD